MKKMNLGSSLLSVTLCACVLAQLCVRDVKCELFTAIVHMEGLLELEEELLFSLNSYITAEKKRLQFLEDLSERVSEAHGLYDGLPPSTHLGDPVNAFQLVNRYSNGWMKLQDHVYLDNSKELMSNISLNSYRLPSSEDFSGSISALQRLKETYQLSISDIASGQISKAPSLKMSAEDCYVIGRKAYEKEQWHEARDWMKEALLKFDESEGTVDLALVYDHLAYSEYKLGNMKKAAQYTHDLLQNEPNHERALRNLDYFNGLRTENEAVFVDAEIISSNEENIEDERSVYEAACREGKPLPSSQHHMLTCFYLHKNNPRLLIQPVKVEVVYPDPMITILHDLLTDAEMNRLKELAGPKLNRATVHDLEGNLVHANYRISKSGWLSSSDDPLHYVDRIDQRIEDVTGLTMTTAEQLQVVNYGIGGHYEPHFDFARDDEDAFSALGTGNRISTLLIYMSDVELGGATVFPKLGLRIAPSKGNAAYWWNLKSSGRGDLRTRHAGCPVLVGDKWVCNKWIHERGQEFRRRCGLNEEE